MISKSVHNTLLSAGVFQKIGAHVLVDGQYGSTGKGLIAGALAEYDLAENMVDHVTTNAGPNSGHTFVDGDEEIMTQQIPVFSCVSKARGRDVDTSLNAGAVIDLDQLGSEVEKYGVRPQLHANAALIVPEVMDNFKSDTVDAIASTGKGVGQAMASRVMRAHTTVGTYGDGSAVEGYEVYAQGHLDPYAGISRTFVETAQGFSLGINSGFYPYTTSRECSVAQALADAQMSPSALGSVVMAVRTFPIRVGNTEKGFSGPCYDDQKEISWADVGVKPELTTVTKRERRVFTWSWEQYSDALIVNQPDIVFLNFCNYMSRDQLAEHIEGMNAEAIMLATKLRIKTVPRIILGFGPETKDIHTVFEFKRGEV